MDEKYGPSSVPAPSEIDPSFPYGPDAPEPVTYPYGPNDVKANAPKKAKPKK